MKPFTTKVNEKQQKAMLGRAGRWRRNSLIFNH
jgi:hypothetical protein